MIRCDRNRLRLWSEGVLLERGPDGVCLIGDWDECEAAEAALERGETVELTSGGRVVSTCALEGGAYVERVTR